MLIPPFIVWRLQWRRGLLGLLALLAVGLLAVGCEDEATPPVKTTWSIAVAGECVANLETKRIKCEDQSTISPPTPDVKIVGATFTLRKVGGVTIAAQSTSGAAPRGVTFGNLEPGSYVVNHEVIARSPSEEVSAKTSYDVTLAGLATIAALDRKLEEIDRLLFEGKDDEILKLAQESWRLLPESTRLRFAAFKPDDAAQVRRRLTWAGGGFGARQLLRAAATDYRIVPTGGIEVERRALPNAVT